MKKIGLILFSVSMFFFIAVLLTLIQRSIAMNLVNTTFSLEKRIRKEKEEIVKLELFILDSLSSIARIDSIKKAMGFYKKNSSEYNALEQNAFDSTKIIICI